MSRSPTRLGSPAFGWIASGRPPATSTICSSTPYKVLEPTEQFAPRAWTPNARRVRATGGRASRERHALVGEGHLRGDGQVGDRADRFDGERDLGEIGERLDDEGVDATLEEPLRLLPERGARVLRRHAP